MTPTRRARTPATCPRRQWRRAIAAFAALVAVTTAAPAAAQPDAPTPQESPEDDAQARDRQARTLYKEADADYAAGRYEQAAAKFARAYELSERPQLLYNLANTHERMGEYQKAADFLKRYLESPRVKDVVSVRERIRRLEAAIEARTQEPHAATDAATETTAQPEGREAGSLATADQSAQGTVSDNQSPAGPARWPSYALMGFGGAAVVGGVLFGVAAQRAGDEADAFCVAAESGVLCQSASKDPIARHKRYALMADISAGVALASAGLAVYLLLRKPGARDQQSAASLQVAPLLTPLGVGVSVGGRL